MVATTPKNSIPYPQQADAPNEATAMANLVGAVDRKLVPRFTNTTDRSTRVPSPSDGMIGYRIDAKRYEIYRGGGWQPFSLTATVYKPSDTARTLSTTPTLDPHLFLPAISGHTYLVEFSGGFAGDPGVDAQFNLLAPSTSGGQQYYITPATASTSLNNANANISSSGFTNPSPTVVTVGTTGSVPAAVIYKAVITAAASGNIGIGWSQIVSSALSTTLGAGAWLSLTDLG